MDLRNYTLLTFCALMDNFDAMKIVYEHAINSDEIVSKNEVKEWSNKPTDKGYTALHFASYHGNMEMVKYLI